MLVLSRKIGEVIVVDGPARFEIIETRKTGSRIAVYADPSVHIWREEIMDRPPKQAVIDGQEAA